MSFSSNCSVLLLNFTYCLYSRLLNGGPGRLYLHADWAAQLSCLNSSILWRNDGRAALRSDIKKSFMQHNKGILQVKSKLKYCDVKFRKKLTAIQKRFDGINV